MSSLQKYQQIKDHILSHIDSGSWPQGEQIPSENQLAGQFEVSRMTARRAVQELTQEGVLSRSQGIGTFVADQRLQSSLLQVKSIADEISARGHQHRCQVITMEEVIAPPLIAMALGLNEPAAAFHSVLLHFDNDHPLQWEERYVNPKLIPDYLAQDFSQQTPSLYLNKVAPLTQAEHLVEAIIAPLDVTKLLEISAHEPCLKVIRKSWCRRGTVSYTRLIHPGSRYRIGGDMHR